MSERANPPLPEVSRARARDLRAASTDAERELWFRLRAGRLLGLKFRRQHPLPPYVVDFYCDAAKLAIEIDGSQHSDDADAVRTSSIEARGVRVLRFWDNEVLSDTDAVLEAIVRAVENRTLTPTPLPMGEGLKNKGPR